MCALISSIALLTTLMLAAGSAQAQGRAAARSLVPALGFARVVAWRANTLPQQQKSVSHGVFEPQSLTHASLVGSPAAERAADATYERLSSSVLRFMQPGKDFQEADSPIRSMRATPLLCHGIGASLTFAIK
ncbi:MAG TPA: hypothetical protein VIA18_25760 [Polyangia bacterium]|nr:hypothetical protein [Polyangia bacterium]